MASLDCPIEVLGKHINKLSPSQREFLEGAIEDYQKYGAKEPLEQARARFQDDVKEIMDQVLEEKEYLMRSIALTAIRKSELRKRIDKFAEAGEGRTEAEGLEAVLVGSGRPIKGARKSIDSRNNAIEKMFNGAMRRELKMSKAGDLEDLLRKKDLDFNRKVAKAMYDLTETQDAHFKKTGKVKPPPILDAKDAPQHVIAAQIINKYQQKAVDWQNANGAYIKNMPGYIVRQSHDMFKIRGTHGFLGAIAKLGRFTNKTRQAFRKKAREDWVDFILPLLDYKKTFKDLRGDKVKIRARLESIWFDLSEGRHIYNNVDADINNISGLKDLADKASARRVLHFNNSDAWFDYDIKFGQGGDLFRAVAGGFDKTARNIAVMETLGPNPQQTYNDVVGSLLFKVKQAESKGGDVADAVQFLRKDLIGRRKRRMDSFFKEVVGATRVPVDTNIARVASNIRKIGNLSKLGGAFISSVADVPLFAREVQRLMGPGIAKGYIKPFMNIIDSFGSDTSAKKEFAEIIGAGVEGQRNALLSRFAIDEDPGGFLSGLQTTLFKITGLQGWTDAHKSGLALMISNKLGLMSDKKWADLGGKHDIGMRGMLESYGIDAKKWEMLRKATREIDGRKYVMPDMVAGMAEGDIMKHLGYGLPSRKALREVDKFRRELETDLRAFMIDRTEFAVATPGARERAFLNRGTAPGTVTGEAWRFFAQFKSFPITVTNKLFGGDIRAQRAGGRGFSDTAKDVASSIMPGAKSGGSTLGTYLVGLTVFGAIAMTAKEAVRGLKPRVFNADKMEPEDWGKWGLAAFVQGGGAGIYADLLIGSATTSRGHSKLETFLGPTWSTASDSLALMSATAKYAVGAGDIPAKQAAYFAKGNIPFMNVWYTKAGMDYLIWYSLMEKLDRGTLRKMERKMRREKKQEFIFSPRKHRVF